MECGRLAGRWALLIPWLAAPAWWAGRSAFVEACLPVSQQLGKSAQVGDADGSLSYALVPACPVGLNGRWWGGLSLGWLGGGAPIPMPCTAGGFGGGAPTPMPCSAQAHPAPTRAAAGAPPGQWRGPAEGPVCWRPGVLLDAGPTCDLAVGGLVRAPIKRPAGRQGGCPKGGGGLQAHRLGVRW